MQLDHFCRWGSAIAGDARVRADCDGVPDPAGVRADGDVRQHDGHGHPRQLHRRRRAAQPGRPHQARQLGGGQLQVQRNLLFGTYLAT